MAKEKSKNIHQGHRDRLKRRFLREGIDNFEEHNIIELLLFFGIPFKDTNGIAHALLDRFGSMSAMMDAPIEELTDVDGVGENAATLIKLIPNLARVYSDQKGEVGEKCNNIEKLGRMLVNRYRTITKETVLLTLLDNSFHIIAIERLYEGSVNSAHISTRRIAELSIRNNASMAVISHNHPNGIAIPSFDDIETTSSLVHVFDSIDTPLLEHILIAGDDYTPIMYNQLGERRFLPDSSKISAMIDLMAFYKKTTKRQKTVNPHTKQTSRNKK